MGYNADISDQMQTCMTIWGADNIEGLIGAGGTDVLIINRAV